MAVGTVRLSIRRWGIAALLAAAALSSAGAASAAVPSGNLIRNPGAETGTPCSGEACQTTQFVVPVPQWTTTSSFTLLAYGGGASTTPGQAPQGGGKQMFAGGFNGGSVGPVATATQDDDVTTAGFEIDLGVVGAKLSALLGGCQADSARLDAVFRDPAGAELGRIAIGPVSRTERNFMTAFVPGSAAGAVPAGTRSIRLVMTATHATEEGAACTAWNDAYFDNLSLSLELNVTVDALKKIQPGDAAKLLLELPADKAAALLAQLAPADAAKILALLSPSQAAALLAASPASGAQILAALSPSQALSIVAAKPASGAKLVAALSPAQAFALLATDPAGGAKILAKLPFGVALKILKAAPAGSSAQVKALVKAMPPKLRAKFSKALHLK